MQNYGTTLLDVDDLRTYFPLKKGLLRRTVGYIKAVDGVSFTIRAGQTLGLVGESGCGKTTVARSIIRLVEPTSGRVIFDRKDVLSANAGELRRIRSQIGIIFQSPYSSLNPRMTAGEIVGEPLKVQRGLAGGGLRPHSGDREQAVSLLPKVGVSAECVNRYPHEFSDGQRQRIAIARALAPRPKLVICDEPTSALDVSIQSQILNLLKDLQQELGLAFLFISHDPAVVEFFCDIVAVMYAGRIIEQAEARELHRNPLHPYTQLLLRSMPRPPPFCFTKARQQGMRNGRVSPCGKPPSVSRPQSCCSFQPRCPVATGDCLKEMPILEEKSKGHFVACGKCKKK